MPRVVSADMTITRQTDASQTTERKYEWTTREAVSCEQSVPLPKPCLVCYDPRTRNVHVIPLSGTGFEPGMQIVELVE